MQYIEGDITKLDKGSSPGIIICQQVNCQNAMGAGLAKSIADAFPVVLASYRQSFKKSSKEDLFGRYEVIPVGNNMYVANMYTQFNYNYPKDGIKNTNTELLLACIRDICKRASVTGHLVAIPEFIGCRLGGGDWDEILPSLNELDLLIVRYNKNANPVQKEVLKPVRIIVAGGRDFTNYEYLSYSLNAIISNNNIPLSDITIVCGLAKGADSLGAKWARENNVHVAEFPAEWDKYGKSAGYIRNKQMAKYATKSVVFWDFKSKGTGHMIDLSREYNLNPTIFPY